MLSASILEYMSKIHWNTSKTHIRIEFDKEVEIILVKNELSFFIIFINKGHITA